MIEGKSFCNSSGKWCIHFGKSYSMKVPILMSTQALMWSLKVHLSCFNIAQEPFCQGLKWSTAVTRLTAHFTGGVRSALMIYEQRKEYCHTQHQMSLLRPSVIKQHVTKLKLRFLMPSLNFSKWQLLHVWAVFVSVHTPWGLITASMHGNIYMPSQTIEKHCICHPQSVRLLVSGLVICDPSDNGCHSWHWVSSLRHGQ